MGASQSAAQGDSDAAQGESTAVPNPEINVATAELAALKTERDELKEILVRRQAEFDNFRKRTERERADYMQFAGMDVVRDMLPVLDDFDRALKVECGSPDYAKGVEMIYNRTFDILKKMGLEPIEAVGKAFDPHLHQAIDRLETNDSPDGTVLSEYQRGYNFKGKLLRPSMVRVSVKP